MSNGSRGRSRTCSVVAALVLFTAHVGGWQPNGAPPGIVVETVARNFAGEAAGLQPGDVLLSWVREPSPPGDPAPARGDLRYPVDLVELEIEEAPRAEVRLSGVRNGRPFSVRLRPGELRVESRPRLEERILASYLEASRLIAANELDTGIGILRDLASRAEDSADPPLRYWLSLEAGDAFADARRWGEADAAYREAVERSLASGAPLAHGWERLGAAFERRSEWSGAEAAYRRALAIRREVRPQGLGVAHSLHLLGVLAGARGDQRAARSFHEESLDLRKRLAPGSLPVAISLHTLGILARQGGELDAATALFRESLAIKDRLAPDSLDVAVTLNALGVVGYQRGDLSGAEALLSRALAINGRLAPDSMPYAATLNGLGVVAWLRGDFARAEDLYRRSLTIHERLVPGGSQVATSLQNLGGVARQRGDLELAQDFLQRSFAIREKLTPNSIDLGAVLSDLGVIALDRGDIPSARAFHERALALRERLAPGTLRAANSLHNLGTVARQAGDHAEAREFYRRALEIREKLAPRSLDVAVSVSQLAIVTEGADDAEALHLRALDIYRALAPGSAAEARTLHSLGTISRSAAKMSEAARYFGLAIDALETQVGRLGGSDEIRAGFAAEFSDVYRDFADVLVDLGDAPAAFAVIERSRARSLLRMLAERELSFGADIPRELDRERQQIARAYDDAQARLLRSANDRATVDAVQGRLAELRDQRDAVAARIRTASPRLAALQYPQPLDLARARGALDPGTAMLSYSVGRDRTILFVVQPQTSSPSGIAALTVPVGAESLRERVGAFRNLIDRASGAESPGTQTLDLQSRQLFDLLVEPARHLIGGARRLVISPDGPLHLLPFAALRLPASDALPTLAPRYLIEWKPIHTVVSATVYAELQKARRPAHSAAGGRLVAFGDPRYPPVSPDAPGEANPMARDTERSGFALEPLPASRIEVGAIARLYGARAVSYVGKAATEERAKSLDRTTRYLHFATHGILDSRFPLNSALVFSIDGAPAEGKENGLLQAWEVFEQVRFDADLVTLSACDSGLGRELGGEGLVGLTRAFQYAGARSVLASLWRIGDESTADLMTRFYRNLRAGQTKDVALRGAQLDLIRSARTGTTGDRSHPFHWAAFTLTGDWR